MPRGSSRQPNHYVGEWFGQRIYPEVQLGDASPDQPDADVPN